VNEILPNGDVLRLESVKLGRSAGLEGESPETKGKNVEATENGERERSSGHAGDRVFSGAVKEKELGHVEQDVKNGEHVVADV